MGRPLPPARPPRHMGPMRRRSLLPLLAALVPAAGAGARPASAQGTPPAAADRADLGRVEAYFNGLRTLKARFLQTAPDGGSVEGTAWIWRPGRMRFEYDPPEPTLLVADSGQFFHYDRELRQPTTVPVGSTPLGLLLRENLRLSGDIAVGRVERVAGSLRVTLHRAAAPAEGRLTLVLAGEPLELRQWVVLDAQARETRVTLSQLETGRRFDPALFAFNDPRFLEDLGRR